jgi:ATP-binding cassette subfamily B protein
MKKNISIISLLKNLWFHIEIGRRWQFSFLLFVMLSASLSEIISLGSVLPFLSILSSPAQINNSSYAHLFVYYLGSNDERYILGIVTIFFGLSAFISGMMRLLLIWLSTRLSFATGSDLSLKVFRITLYQSYASHCSRNSSEVIDGIVGKSSAVIYNIIMPALSMISSCLILIAILITLVFVNPLNAFVSFAGFGFIYFIIFTLTRTQLLNDSVFIARESTNLIKSIQEGLGGIRDVIIDGSQEFFCQIYSKSDRRLRKAQGNSLFIGSSPRYAVEALGMILIAALAYKISSQHEDFSSSIPLLGALALGAQRILPIIQQIYLSIVQINSGQTSLIDTLELLNQPVPAHFGNPVSPLKFNHSINLQNVYFSYQGNSPYILNDINISIKKGSRVGFIGATGSGKSTLLDIVMGLLQPNRGYFIVDDHRITLENNRNWQSNIAHVPQAIFLSDSSVAENIAFGQAKEEIDYEKVKNVAVLAQIAETVEGLPYKYNTIVGERGVRLSGGQRQRIGIARALYKDANIIIFDEATSALDEETEKVVMYAIENLSSQLTLLIIAHRLSTLKHCDQIVHLDEGGIKRIGTYKEIIG